MLRCPICKSPETYQIDSWHPDADTLKRKVMCVHCDSLFITCETVDWDKVFMQNKWIVEAVDKYNKEKKE